SAGLETVALRCPIHGVDRDLLMYAGRPIAAPSANRSGRISATTAADVQSELGDSVDLILDGGACTVGIESAVLDLTGTVPVLLRPGGVPIEELTHVLGRIDINTSGESAPRSPGRLPSHYAPSLPMRLEAAKPQPGE